MVPEQLKLVELQDHRFRHILVKYQFRCNLVDKENIEDQKTVAGVLRPGRTEFFGEFSVNNLYAKTVISSTEYAGPGWGNYAEENQGKNDSFSKPA